MSTNHNELTGLVNRSAAPVAYGAASCERDVATRPEKPGAGEPESWAACCKAIALFSTMPYITSATWYYYDWAVEVAIGNLLTTTDLAAFSIANMAFCFFGLYPLIGMTAALDTVCSQVFGRDPDSVQQGVACQRTLFIGAALCAPLSVLLYFMCPPLVTYFYGPVFGDVALRYMTWAPIYLVTQLIGNALGKFLNHQLKTHWTMLCNLIAAVMILPTARYAIRITGNVDGAIIAVCAASTVQVIVAIVVIVLDPAARRRFGPVQPLSVLLQWRPLRAILRLGLHAALFVGMEAGAFISTITVAGTISPTAAAVWTDVLFTLLFSQAASCAFSTAAAALVGQAVGAGHKTTAKRMALSALLLAFVEASIASCFFVYFHKGVFGLMTSDPAVEREISSLLWVIPFYHVCDCVQYVFEGIYSGCGRNHWGVLVIVGVLWCVGIPAQLYGSATAGLAGQIFCFCCAMTIEIPVYLVILFTKFDWQPYDDGEEEELADLVEDVELLRHGTEPVASNSSFAGINHPHI